MRETKLTKLLQSLSTLTLVEKRIHGLKDIVLTGKGDMYENAVDEMERSPFNDIKSIDQLLTDGPTIIKKFREGITGDIQKLRESLIGSSEIVKQLEKVTKLTKIPDD